MKLKYKQQVHDGPRTMEQQMSLLAERATRAVDMFDALKYPDSGLAGDLKPDEEKMQQRMRNLRIQILETDIFMSGYHAGENQQCKTK